MFFFSVIMFLNQRKKYTSVLNEVKKSERATIFYMFAPVYSIDDFSVAIFFN